MGSQPVNADLAAELWNELAEVRTSFPPAEELIAKGGLHIGRDRAKFMRSRIAPLVRQLNSDEARTVLGEARQLAALGECFVYLHWVSQIVGAPSTTFRNYASHYLSSAIPLLEDRAGDGPRGAAKGRTQARQPDVEALRSLLNEGLDMPVHYAPAAPPTPAGNAGERAPAPLAHPPAGPPAQDTRADRETLIRIEELDAEPAPATLSAPKTSRASARGRSGAGRRPRRTGRPPLGIALGKYILALIGAVIAGAVVAVAVLAAARMGASLSGWPKRDRMIVGGVTGGVVGGVMMLVAARPGRRLKRDTLLVWAVSVIVSVIGVACVSAKPNAMKLVDANVTGLAALMSERFGRMMSEGGASILSATIICAVIGVVLGATIGFTIRLLVLLPERLFKGWF